MYPLTPKNVFDLEGKKSFYLKKGDVNVAKSF